MATDRLWTFGHSTRSADETVALLREFGIERIVDVRTIRGSRHNPQFGVDPMVEWLAGADIDYRWVEQLGGRRRKQPVDSAVNAGWTHQSFHKYADYALSDEFAAGLAELIGLADVPTAFMCAEAVPWRCHRSLIATALVVSGWQVTHIFGLGHSEDHVIGKWGATPEIDDAGRITYPAAQLSLEQLLLPEV
ncbi:MAG: DUF488 domain-containing protein [Nakamurella sp.]